MEEWRIGRTTVAVYENDALGQTAGSGGLCKDAPEGSDPNPTRENDSWPRYVIQRQLTKRAFDLDLGAERYRLQVPLEGRISKTSCYRDDALAGGA